MKYSILLSILALSVLAGCFGGKPRGVASAPPAPFMASNGAKAFNFGDGDFLVQTAARDLDKSWCAAGEYAKSRGHAKIILYSEQVEKAALGGAKLPEAQMIHFVGVNAALQKRRSPAGAAIHLSSLRQSDAVILKKTAEEALLSCGPAQKGA